MDQKHFRVALEKEQQQLEEQLSTVGRPDPIHQENWEETPLPEHDEAFRDEVADDLEELGEREEVELGLEKRLRQVRAALARLEAGTYGKCEVGGEEIEAERLEVNPAARTCKAHLEEEGTLV
jgi:RNA polymerase-binding transcription factor DksA